MIEIWQRYSKPMQLAFLDFDDTFDCPHRGRLLKALRADGVPGKFVRSLDDMNQPTIAAVITPAGCTTLFKVVAGVRQITLGLKYATMKFSMQKLMWYPADDT
ncbi:hypothetical protein RB195_022768 [Necator americanus]|uniref:Reverse transcriptase domain-containing protein n=1 Tax=Necator americanus TaxID=51031 RepID=A0ABR1EGJ8_NECAM